MSSLALSIPLAPKALARPRATVVGGHVRIYEPSGNREAMWRLREAAEGQCGPEPFRGPLRVSLTAWMPLPKATAKYRRRTVRPTKRPDLDNLVKLLLEAMHGLLWRDDAQIVELVASKRYALEEDGRMPSWELRVTELDQEEGAERCDALVLHPLSPEGDQMCGRPMPCEFHPAA